ncbi:hypothetical protein NL676_029156 [Syzygium grande]|nr:hypothetical protein NL676_029156 [Syzygium grande]
MRWERVLLPQAQKTEQGREEAGGSRKGWGHTCNTIKGRRFLYVFGGFGKDNCQTNRLHIFDTVEQTWSQPTITGTPTAPRDGHSFTNVGDNLFVSGGTDGTNPLADLHILDTPSHTWISPITRGEAPEARQGHSAAPVCRRLFIFGGHGKSPDDEDEDTLMWKQLNTTGDMLPPRGGRLTVPFGKILFVYGGYTEDQKLYDDLYMLHVGKYFTLCICFLNLP